ncbi:hypothetical protein PPTG_11670 [Phytophthora nicotianae INRA-310]|uniref:Uncharacterized protein n=2 Tax=Phytophthora nicotianae TaxID=4792 RepID=W2Q7N8_PHYN3|nr:hypothetical protein PPTG_11670 [Phytophthora nicotianae INRA-310]ETN08856.1 hypothetical protein PPTG_11670 [Phytophthora nicotianae INRA-310]KUF78514.1 hypothetical protein AM587_10001630 [Phytophthora nicotianae]KUF84199.1 hypothetical protein AM587_10001658 [Phytophthora nicotianae]KUF90752.1 hypothetical protein AM588_10002949 [Phytophthora nicotianae]
MITAINNGGAAVAPVGRQDTTGAVDLRLRDWADSTLQEWTKQVEADWRRQQHREGMARLRTHRRSQLKSMQNERAQLELQYNQYLAQSKRAATKRNESELSQAMNRLVLESDALRTENVDLWKRLQQHKRLCSLTEQGLNDFRTENNDASNENVYEASQKSQWTTRSHDLGWRVHFRHSESSFFFHPFAREQFEDVITQTKDSLDNNLPHIKRVGTLFGWSMHYAPPTQREDQSVLTQARFTTRFACSLDDMNNTIRTSKVAALPLIVTPPDWDRSQRNKASTQVLQEIEKDAYVMACNIPGPVHLRYLYFLRRLSRTMANGMRKVFFVQVVASSKENERSRAAEEPQDEVEWVQGGGTFVTLTEVDEGTVDLSYDHWASCQDDRHAQNLFFQWAQFLSRWSQQVMLSRLLEPGEEESGRSGTTF